MAGGLAAVDVKGEDIEVLELLGEGAVSGAAQGGRGRGVELCGGSGGSEWSC